MCILFITIVIRSARNRKKISDDGKPVAVSHYTESSTIKIDKNGVTSTIINIDVPDSENTANQISLGEHKINEKQNASVATATTATTTDIAHDATDLLGADAWLRQKQWHRRLQTPVWARCSIKIKFSVHFIYFCISSVTLYLSLSIRLTLTHTLFSITDSI